jgi:hypothetical protein
MMIADSDVLIDFLQGKGSTAERIALGIEQAQLHPTAVTRFELLAGVPSSCLMSAHSFWRNALLRWSELSSNNSLIPWRGRTIGDKRKPCVLVPIKSKAGEYPARAEGKIADSQFDAAGRLNS